MDRGTKMNNTKNYANQWDISAQFFYEKGYYSWMAQRINKFQTVVEVGCGTGYSTLALVENGHKVIAIDKNRDCIAKAKQLLLNRGIAEDSVIFIEGDIAEDSFRSRITSTFEFDVVLCWNVGSYWSKEMIEYYLPSSGSLMVLITSYDSSFTEIASCVSGSRYFFISDIEYGWITLSYFNLSNHRKRCPIL